MAYYCIVFITTTMSIVACAASLTCFNCTGVTHIDACRNNITCEDNEVCFTQKKYSGQISYDLGCMESKKCGNFANLPTGISKIDNDKGQTYPCFECCSRDRCNSNLCQYKDPAMCVDDERVDCAFYNSLFNFCEDINQAKKVCPKYCKLCQVVDGNWTPWSNWSDCDVTCENGIQIRTRSCTDPAPQFGGLDCWGNDTETKSCHREPCPIHGGWSEWLTWSECSVSCDIGMQHRDRFCTNPRPSLFGDHCFGSAEQYRVCMPGACADGGWSAWGSWGSCSKIGERGIISKNRTCSNPAPSITGKQCLGNSEQVSVCKKDCGLLSTIMNGKVTAPLITHGAKGVYECNFGYQKTSGDTLRTCHDGYWTGTEARCTPIQDVGCYRPGYSKLYRGRAKYTKGGVLCQRWDTQSPHKHGNNNPVNFPENDTSAAGQYCRDPDLEGAPWCYSTKSNLRWTFCGVQRC